MGLWWEVEGINRRGEEVNRMEDEGDDVAGGLGFRMR